MLLPLPCDGCSPSAPLLPYGTFIVFSPIFCFLAADLQWNDGEAQVVMEHVRRLMAAGVAAADIGVITPYNAQVGGVG